MATNGVRSRTVRVRRPRRNNGTHATTWLKEKASDLNHDLKAMGGIVKDAAYEKAEQFGERAAEYYDQGREKLGSVQQSAARFIRERPFQSVVVAVGVGLLFGRFWGRR